MFAQELGNPYVAVTNKGETVYDVIAQGYQGRKRTVQRRLLRRTR